MLYQIQSVIIITVFVVVILGYGVCARIIIEMKNVDARFAKSKYVL